MKFIITLLTICCAYDAAMATSTVTILPGSSVTVNAGEQSVIQCIGDIEIHCQIRMVSGGYNIFSGTNWVFSAETYEEAVERVKQLRKDELCK